ncbi:hypothetical protein [Streptococcus halichoeri]|uniref:hypothetical protein n=1 Tax=Streptococcus halichoeri TaxID=254785 RepID=UPI001357F886|nr:hypothetical protein [Streptococcus halichoeri]
MKIVKKKAIATVAVLALAGIGLTQVSTASADTTKWDPTTVDLYRGFIKIYKTHLPNSLTAQQVEKQFAQKTGIYWEDADHDLEEQLSDAVLGDLLIHYHSTSKTNKAN